MIGEQGQYMINEVPPRKQKAVIDNKPRVKKPPMQHRTRNVGTLVDAVHQWPQFPGGADAFMKYLESLGKDMVAFLPVGVKKAYVQVEFIIDKDGVPVNFKILRSVKDSDDFNDELIIRMENMGTWNPALLHDKPVAKKMVQTITIEVPEK
jgi:hypothetical protein